MKAIQKKEKRLYSLTLNHADSLKAYTRLNDPYGREILVSRQGKIQYLFSSSSYKRLFPEDTHYPFFWEEAEGLYGKKEFGKSLLLLKGLKLCNLLKQTPVSNRDVQKKINEIEGLGIGELGYESEPYGCIQNKKNKRRLHLESKIWRYSFELPATLEYLFPEKKNVFTHKEYFYSYSRFRLLPERKENLKPDFYSEYKRLTEGEDLKAGLYVSIGNFRSLSSYRLNMKSLKRFWDRKRGISQSLKNRLFRETVVAQNEFLYSYSVRGNDGKVESFYTHEFYFLTGQNGLVVFLNYPENLREKAKEIEESIKNSIKMK